MAGFGPISFQDLFAQAAQAQGAGSVGGFGPVSLPDIHRQTERARGQGGASSVDATRQGGVPNVTHFVWVGAPIPAADLLTAGHFAARGAGTQLWSDQPRAAVRVLASLHHSSAGAIDIHLPQILDGRRLPHTAADPIRHDDACRRWAMNLRRLDEAFDKADLPRETRLRLDSIQAREGAGLGNPARRSDVIRVVALINEGGVYMDFDRAELLRGEFKRSRPHLGERGVEPYPQVEGGVFPPHGFVCPKLANAYMPQNANNDLMAARPGNRLVREYCLQIEQAYMAMDTPGTLPGVLRENQRAQHEETVDRMRPYRDIFSKIGGMMMPPLRFSLAQNVARLVPALSQGVQPARADQATMNDQMRAPFDRAGVEQGDELSPAINEVMKTELTFAAAGPSALDRMVSELPWSESEKLHDLSELAKRLSVGNRTIREIPGRGSWRTDGDKPPRSFED